ncbi:hypothetical protein [Streptomyces olivochromogenes]|uniref:hypothetical protein n=1 Tax=Streptomyces olivochromogenes TaxID=1963 RepID=UPI001F2F46C1|nr:hypothetical protein [Streptomyces olivochromogenes]MCF3128932.1 hypothetical protein [Streptomyces olivochromogenes]
MAISYAATRVPAWPVAAVGTAAVVVPGAGVGSGYAAALARQGWQPVAVDLEPQLRPRALARANSPGPYVHRVEHRGSLRQTVKALRALGVSAVVAGSTLGIGLAERLMWHLDLPGADPVTALLRHDQGAQAAALRRAGIPALRGVRTTSLAAALTWAETCPLPGYMLAPATAGSPVEPVVCANALQISATWSRMRRQAAEYSGDAHLVLAEHVPGRRYVVNSVTRLVDGQPDHVVTDVWAQTYTPSGRLARTDLLDRHHLLTRALSMHVLRVLDALGIVCGPVTSQVAHSAERGPLLISALAVPGISPADAALSAATGRDRLADALSAVITPSPAERVAVPTGHRVVRVHLDPRHGARIAPWAHGALRRLPTVVAVTDHPRPDAPPTSPAAGLEVVLSGAEPEAIEADYRAVRALERASLYPAAVGHRPSEMRS